MSIRKNVKNRAYISLLMVYKRIMIVSCHICVNMRERYIEHKKKVRYKTINEIKIKKSK